MSMKKGMKRICTIAAIILVLCLIPLKDYYKDGGSVRYKAVFYEITRWHEMSDTEPDGFRDGLQIKILGFTIYDRYFD